jgi:hypothetical protein
MSAGRRSRLQRHARQAGQKPIPKTQDTLDHFTAVSYPLHQECALSEYLRWPSLCYDENLPPTRAEICVVQLYTIAREASGIQWLTCGGRDRCLDMISPSVLMP